MAPLNISYEPAFDLLARLLFGDEDPDQVLMDYTIEIALNPMSFPEVPHSGERWGQFSLPSGTALILTFRVDQNMGIVSLTAIAAAMAVAA